MDIAEIVIDRFQSSKAIYVTPAGEYDGRSLNENESGNECQLSVQVVGFAEDLVISESIRPKPTGYEVLVKNFSIGLNPIDWKAKKFKFGIYAFPWINGRDSSGIIHEVGNRALDIVNVGDEVILCSTSYRDNRTSTFQEYSLVDSRLLWKKPKSWTFNDGATLGVGLVTSGAILHKSFAIPFDTFPGEKEGKIIVIWGGSTVVGTYLTQLCKNYGLEVISIASSKHEPCLKKIGVDLVIDRSLPLGKIKKLIQEKIQGKNVDYAVDCVSKETSVDLAKILQDIAKNTKKLTKLAAIVGSPKVTSPNIKENSVCIKNFHEDIQFAEQFISKTSKFLMDGKIVPIRQKRFRGGLADIIHGLKELERHGASGEKYVVEIR